MPPGLVHLGGTRFDPSFIFCRIDDDCAMNVRGNLFIKRALAIPAKASPDLAALATNLADPLAQGLLLITEIADLGTLADVERLGVTAQDHAQQRRSGMPCAAHQYGFQLINAIHGASLIGQSSRERAGCP